MKRAYYLFSNGRLCRRQNTLCLERATEARTPGAELEGTGCNDVHVASIAFATGDGVPADEMAFSTGESSEPTGHPDGDPSHDAINDDGRPSGDLTGEKVPFPVESAASIFCFGEIDINSKVASFLSKHHVPLHFFDYYGNYRATLYPKEHLLSGRLLVKQVRHYDDSLQRMKLARAFVDAAMGNIRRVLRYYASRTKGPAAETLSASIGAIEELRGHVDAADAPADLMGLEGRARRHYYQAWPSILGKHGTAFPFERRSRQPPSNPLNALISFGNSLCYAAVVNQLYHTALDPTISYLHEPGDRRFSLALDVAEVFKPLLVDRAIFRLIKTRQIQPSDFEERLGGTYLSESGRRVFVEHWDDRLQQTIQHRDLGRKVSYGRLLRLEAYRLVRHLCDPTQDPYEGFQMRW